MAPVFPSWFRLPVQRGRGSGSPHSASHPSAVVIAWQCGLPPPLPITPRPILRGQFWMPDRLGRDTLGLLELINRLDAMGVDLTRRPSPRPRCWICRWTPRMWPAAVSRSALVTAGVAAIERTNISRRTKQGLEWGPGGARQAGRAALEHHPGADAHHTLNAEKPGPDPGPDRPGSGSVGIAAVRLVLKVEDVEALAGEFKNGWDSGGRAKTRSSRSLAPAPLVPTPRPHRIGGFGLRGTV